MPDKPDNPILRYQHRQQELIAEHRKTVTTIRARYNDAEDGMTLEQAAELEGNEIIELQQRMRALRSEHIKELAQNRMQVEKLTDDDMEIIGRLLGG